MAHGDWFFGEDETFIKKITNTAINKQCFLAIDAATMIGDYYQDVETGGIIVEYEVYDKDNNLMYKTPESIVYNHRYPNKGYLTLSQKYKNYKSKNGCYIIDTAENLNQIRKIKFKFSYSNIENESYYYIFNVKPKFKKAQISKIQFHLLLDQNKDIGSGFMFRAYSPSKDGIGAQPSTIEHGLFGRYENDNHKSNFKKKTIEFLYTCEFKGFDISPEYFN